MRLKENINIIVVLSETSWLYAVLVIGNMRILSWTTTAEGVHDLGNDISVICKDVICTGTRIAKDMLSDCCNHEDERGETRAICSVLFIQDVPYPGQGWHEHS